MWYSGKEKGCEDEREVNYGRMEEKLMLKDTK